HPRSKRDWSSDVCSSDLSTVLTSPQRSITWEEFTRLSASTQKLSRITNDRLQSTSRNSEPTVPISRQRSISLRSYIWFRPDSRRSEERRVREGEKSGGGP